MNQAPPVYELHIKPTYSVIIPQRPTGSRVRSVAQKLNEQNLKRAHSIDPETGEKIVKRNQLSRKAVRRLTNAVNWLVASARKKYVYERISGKRFSFKINFVTLTLPADAPEISDHRFKSVLIHNFINTCRYKFGLANYVWKVEAQENGKIHAHFTTDTFIHWRDLRSVWNQILLKNGLLDNYIDRHNSMSFDDYCNTYNAAGSRSIDAMRKAFEHGTSTGWKEPNSTDVHSVWKVKDIAAYLAKYMGKNEEDRREIKGRLWGCSFNLSDQNKCVTDICAPEDRLIVAPLYSPAIESKEIEVVNKTTGQIYSAGHIFFYSLADWGTKLTGEILNIYNSHRFNIRHNIDVKAQKTVIVDEIKPPEFARFEVDNPSPGHLTISIPF
jgi:hypothetical protein